MEALKNSQGNATPTTANPVTLTADGAGNNSLNLSIVAVEGDDTTNCSKTLKVKLRAKMWTTPDEKFRSVNSTVEYSTCLHLQNDHPTYPTQEPFDSLTFGALVPFSKEVEVDSGEITLSVNAQGQVVASGGTTEMTNSQTQIIENFTSGLEARLRTVQADIFIKSLGVVRLDETGRPWVLRVQARGVIYHMFQGWHLDNQNKVTTRIQCDQGITSHDKEYIPGATASQTFLVYFKIFGGTMGPDGSC